MECGNPACATSEETSLDYRVSFRTVRVAPSSCQVPVKVLSRHCQGAIKELSGLLGHYHDSIILRHPTFTQTCADIYTDNVMIGPGQEYYKEQHLHRSAGHLYAIYKSCNSRVFRRYLEYTRLIKIKESVHTAQTICCLFVNQFNLKSGQETKHLPTTKSQCWSVMVFLGNKHHLGL